MIEIRLAFPQRSPQPFMVPCTWVQPASTAARALATARSASLWVWMPSRVGIVARTDGDHLGDEAGQAAAVGVAEDDPVGARFGRGLQGGQRVVPVGPVAVEEVLGVVDHLFALAAQEGDAVADHGQVLFQRGLQDVHDVQGPGLAVDADGGRARLDQGPQVGVVSAATPALRVLPKAVSRACLQPQLGARAAEELDVLGVGPGVAAFDVLDAEPVEQPRDLELVLDRKGETLALGPVSQAWCRTGGFAWRSRSYFRRETAYSTIRYGFRIRRTASRTAG